MKKAIFVIKDFHSFGGGQAHLVGKANWMSDSGFRVKVCTFGKSSNETITNRLNDEINHTNLGNSLTKNVLTDKAKKVFLHITKYVRVEYRFYYAYIIDILHLRRYIKYENPDYVISYVPDSNLVAGYACQNLPVKHAMEHTSDPFTFVNYKKFGSELKKLAEKAFVNIFLLHKYADFISDDNYKSVIPAYIDEDRFPLNSIQDLNKKNIILSVSKINKNKNILLLVKAFSLISKDYPDWKLCVYGEKTDNQYGKIVKIIKENNLSNKIIFYEPQLNLETIYSSASIFAFPSLSEGWSRSLNEAMYFGLPSVVVSDCFATNKVVTTSNGGLVAENDIYDFAYKLSVLIEDKTLRNQLSSNAKEFASKLTKDKVLDKWISIFK